MESSPSTKSSSIRTGKTGTDASLRSFSTQRTQPPPPPSPVPRELADCPICSALWDCFAYHIPNQSRVKAGQEIKRFDVKAWRTPASPRCSAHMPMIRVYRDYILPMRLGRQHVKREKLGKVVLETVLDATNEAAIISRDPWEVYPGSATDVDKAKTAAHANFELVHRPEIENHPGTATVLDKWIDLSTAQEWKKSCWTHHQKTCWKTHHGDVAPMRPAWLVDVRSRCLVRGGDVAGSYVALSYAWGTSADDKTAALKVDKAMQIRLQRHDSLDKKPISSHLSPTIRHAMFVTEAMGERYLWVDAFCIVRDSSGESRDETAKELERMGSIYANAAFTIVVAQGASSDGIPGLKKRGLLKKRISQPRGTPQTVFPFGPNERLAWRDLEKADPCGFRPYCERGWTFQQQYLSPRKLIFALDRVHWQCQHSTQYEGSILSANALDDDISRRMSTLRDGYPDINALEGIVNPYNSDRIFKYPEDTLPGILGLLTVLSRPFRGFMYGIPINMFDACLNWTPKTKTDNDPQSAELARRKPSGRPPEEGYLHPSGLPSWSWVGWRGRVSLGGRHCMGPRDGGGLRFIDETTPITEWWAGDSPSRPPPSSSTFKIESTAWHKAMTKRQGWTEKSPLDLSRVRLITPRSRQIRRPYMWPDDVEEYVFTSTSGVKDFGRGIMEEWPFDLPWDVKSDLVDDPAPVPQLSYLFCQTKRADLTVTRRLRYWEAWGGSRSGKENQKHTNVVALAYPQKKKFNNGPTANEDDDEDDDTTMIGALHLHTAEEAIKLGDFALSPNARGRRAKVELVAINKTRRFTEPVDVYEDQQHRGRGPVPLNIGPAVVKTNRIGVLWIEWDSDGVVATRKASGWVYEEDWDRLPGLQDIDLILG